MADEPQELHPPPLPPNATRRPTDHELSFRPTLTRKPSDLLPPPAQGQFTPELSPLDAFVSRGRQLYRQLELEEARKRGTSKSPDASNNSQTSLSSQQSTSQPQQGQQPLHPQFLQQPPKFIRSHSAGAEQQLGVGTLNAAVEQWAIGNAKSVTGGDRATRFFSSRGGPSPFANGGKMPQVSVAPGAPSPGYPSPRTAPLPGQPQQTSLAIKEPGFRPVSQHPRISGIGFEEDLATPPRGMQHIMVDKRGSSVNRSTASSPRSPRMPFTSDDDSSDEEEDRRRRRESARRRDLERRRPVSTGRRMDPSLVREEGELIPAAFGGAVRNSLVGGMPQRSFSGASPSPKPMDAVEQARKGSLDSNSARQSMTNTPTFQTRIPTPPLSTTPARTIHSSPEHKRQVSGLAAPSLPVASTSTPNLLLRSHTADGMMTGASTPRTPRDGAAPTITSLMNEDDSLFLPPQPAFAKSAPNTPRPSSAMSDTASIYSVGGTKRAFNFSRPMSKTSFYEPGEGFGGPMGRSPSMDLARPPRRTDSLDYRSFVEEAERNDQADEENFGDVNSEMRGPRSFTPRHRTTGSGLSGRVGASESYTYSAYTLPRGRQVDRSSIVFFDGERHRFDVDEDGIPIVKRTNSNGTENSMSPSSTAMPASPFAAMRASQESQRSMIPPPTPSQVPLPPPTLGRSPSSESNSSVLRPRTSGVQKLSPEEHLNIGIPLHEKGSYAESTYHFRLSALGGNTTGMLMYALALRHGWGMRANQAEAFNWLRKAALLAQDEMASAEKDPSKPKPTWWESKSMRSKFALTTYELGMSYTNGWGCTEDKTVGLKYFEIAASWGDVDALSEAGYAYANGQGCKKDLKKSAKYYRQAADNGVSMVGNSWIWKEKYDDEDDKGRKGKGVGKDKEKEKDKDGKDKSGLLSFSRKKSVA
ncbi:hypothetical protein H072_7374 [Dactylellina haptotyla CBS 200.50]|uniref:Uncharacterized protein n=1 Tax=Dactylellina haptotyla (strain CBS 200.50) TaxID=1284197 RepID=S8BUC2_DACHA|nr:hypothetical protein H072_7374 [Dactylellina haptotyla CBS 200.50]